MNVLKWVYLEFTTSSRELFILGSNSWGSLSLSLTRNLTLLDTVKLELGVRMAGGNPSSEDLHSASDFLGTLSIFIGQRNNLG
jgi:hypothetical protein